MKIVVIGGTGLIGSKVASRLTRHSHKAVAAAPSTGVNTLTGQGLAEVLQGAQVIVDVSNSSSFEERPAMTSSEHQPTIFSNMDLLLVWHISPCCQ